MALSGAEFTRIAAGGSGKSYIVFTAKVAGAAPVVTITRIGVGGAVRVYVGFTAKASGTTVVSTKHRSLYMAINYESILEDVTPSDTVDLSATGMLYIGTGGDVKVDAINSGTVTLKNVPNGTWLNFMRVKRVYSTGTTATDIVLAR